MQLRFFMPRPMLEGAKGVARRGRRESPRGRLLCYGKPKRRKPHFFSRWECVLFVKYLENGIF